MASLGFLEEYVVGALLSEDMLPTAAVLIGQSPGFGWGVLPVSPEHLEGVTMYPVDVGAPADFPLSYVRFPLHCSRIRTRPSGSAC